MSFISHFYTLYSQPKRPKRIITDKSRLPHSPFSLFCFCPYLSLLLSYLLRLPHYFISLINYTIRLSLSFHFLPLLSLFLSFFLFFHLQLPPYQQTIHRLAYLKRRLPPKFHSVASVVLAPHPIPTDLPFPSHCSPLLLLASSFSYPLRLPFVPFVSLAHTFSPRSFAFIPLGCQRFLIDILPQGFCRSRWQPI